MTPQPNARYRGYRDADLAQPYAKYMANRVEPAPARVHEAIAAGPVDRALIPSRAKLADDLLCQGYSAVETGYGQLRSGEVWVACLTDMPRVQPEMWDWWFAWHPSESARYKLWHPEGHEFAALGGDGVTSYVDERIGGQLDQLAIRFVPPERYGVDLGTFDGTAICGTVGSSLAPLNVGMVCHQVRRTEHGSEMRSRFYLNVRGWRPPDLRGSAAAVRRGIARPRRLPFREAFGADLLLHCGEEMHHLAQFLPELHAEFAG